MEQWKDIPGYEGHYQVSDIGNVRSLERTAWNGFKYHTLKGRILKTGHQVNGYVTLALCKEGVARTKMVHRLVAQAFVPNPSHLPEVNHKKGNKDDNRASELEWVTKSDNERHAHKLGLKIGAMKGKFNELSSNSKPVEQLNEAGELIKVWPSFAEVGRQLGYDIGWVRDCAKGRRKTANGFIWKYAS